MSFIRVFLAWVTIHNLVQGAEDEEFVVTLTKDNFSDFIKKGRRIVEFYAPWCGHCKSLAPEYEKAAKTLAEKKRKTKLGKCDATVEGGLAGEYGVSGYPTLFYFVDGVKAEYNGPRQADGIVEWAEAREKDPVEICTEEMWKEKIANKTSPFLIRADVPAKSGKATALRKAMGTYLAKNYASIEACLIPIKPEDEGKAKMLLLNNEALTQKEISYPEKRVWNQGKISSWLIESMFSGVGLYGVKKYSILSESDAKFVVAIAAPGKEALVPNEREDWIKAFESLSKDASISSKVKFAVWEGEIDERKDLGGLAGALESQRAIALQVEGTKKYSTADSKPKDIKAWVSSLLDNKLKPDYKSKPVPTNLVDEDGVTVLVGSNFEEIAFSSSKDVFVEFYAPWCGHCKALAPEWSKLAKKIKEMKLDSKVVIAKIDATENETPIAVDGFPQIYLFPAMKNSEKKKKSFTGGERKMHNLLDFLGENARNMEGLETGGEKIDKGSFSMVDRELKKKKKAGNAKKEEL